MTYDEILDEAAVKNRNVQQVGFFAALKKNKRPDHPSVLP